MREQLTNGVLFSVQRNDDCCLIPLIFMFFKPAANFFWLVASLHSLARQLCCKCSECRKFAGVFSKLERSTWRPAVMLCCALEFFVQPRGRMAKQTFCEEHAKMLQLLLRHTLQCAVSPETTLCSDMCHIATACHSRPAVHVTA